MEKAQLDEILYNRPGYLIRRLHQIAEVYFNAEAARYGVTSLQHGAMLAIRAMPGIDQLRLGNAMRCDRTTVSGVVRRLEAKKLIRRRTGKADRRAKALFITREGERMLERLSEVAAHAQQRILTGLSDAERKRALELLGRVVRHFEQKSEG